MRRSQGRRGRALERVSGVVVEREPPVARPVSRRRSPAASAPRVEGEVVVRHVYDAPPAPAAPPRRVPMWAIVVGYFAGIAGLVLLLLALSSGPIIQPPHTPTHPVHERGVGR